MFQYYLALGFRSLRRNPVLTILALAFRTAEQIARVW